MSIDLRKLASVSKEPHLPFGQGDELLVRRQGRRQYLAHAGHKRRGPAVKDFPVELVLAGEEPVDRAHRVLGELGDLPQRGVVKPVADE
jgi:hypothetical protein